MSDPFFSVAHLQTYAIAALLISLMISLVNRVYGRDYLRRWSLTFLLVAVADGMILLSATTHGSRLLAAVSVVTGVCVGALVWGQLTGGFEMALSRPMPARTSRIILTISVLVAIPATSAASLLGPGVVGMAAIDSFAAGSSAVMAATLFLWERRRRLAPGFIVSSGAIVLYAIATLLDGLRYAGVLTSIWIDPLVLFSLVVAGCSIVLFAVEDDRQAALLAATQIEHIAYYDALTGLPNRSLFMDRLIAVTSGTEERSRAAVIFIDVDRLKSINDSFGHATGDALLRTIGRRLREAVRSTDTAARYAGDEFIVLVEQLHDEADASRVASKLLEVLSCPVIVGSHRIETSGSLGVALFPEHGETAETLIRHADSAMYAAKVAGRNQFRLHAPGQERVPRGEPALEESLRDAIARQSLSVVYQPIVRLSDGRVAGVEALLRWEDGIRGAIPPSEFIPVAEAARLVGPLGELVLNQVCRDLQHLDEPRGTVEPFFVSINLSPEQFLGTDLPHRVARAITTHGIEPRRLQFEVSEPAVAADPIQSRHVIEALKGVGVRVAIDCFGSGSLTLPALASLPVDMLKLDRSLTRNASSNASRSLPGAVVALARQFHASVVAEGIETREQLEAMVAAGCKFGQGFLLGEPGPAREIATLLQPSETERASAFADADIEAISRAEDIVGEQGATPPLAVVVDDDERMRSLIGTLLRRAGYEVVQAADGSEGFALFAELGERRVAVALVDLMMPRMSGWELLDRVADTLPWLSSRIVLVTAAGTDRVRRIDPALYGAVLEKPFEHADFHEAVVRCSFPPDPGNRRGEQPMVH